MTRFAADVALRTRSQRDHDTKGTTMRILAPRSPRFMLAVLLLVTSLAVGGTLPAHGALQRGATHCPGSRGFSAFAVSALNPQVVYAGTEKCVFKSTDAGKSWRPVNAGLSDSYVYDVAIDQRHPAILFAATWRSVFKSTNGGTSWRTTSLSNVDGVRTVALALHPRNPRVIYAATDDGVYKSGDAGATWRRVKTAPRVSALVIDPQRPATVYAGSGAGVFKSTDAGRTWKAMSRGLFPRGSASLNERLEGFVSAMVVDAQRPQTLFLGSERGVFRSTDGARTWRPANEGLTGGRGAGALWYYVGSLAIDPSAPNTLYTVVSDGLFKTVDGGRHWTAIGPPGRGNVSALTLDPTDPETIYAGIYAGRSEGARAFKSTDGGRTWTRLRIPVP